MRKRRIFTVFICAITGTILALNSSSGIFAEEKEPVEIFSRRSEYGKHYDNGNGTYTAFVNTAPLHYYENGQWCEIDNSLEINEYGDYENKSNSMEVTLASSATPKTVNTVGNAQMVQLTYDGYSISWDMINTQQKSNHISASSSVQLVTKDLSEDGDFALGGEKLTEKAKDSLDKLNSSVIYTSVFEDVDVSLDILPSSIKETIILNDKASVPEQFAYYITADGLDAELQADNSIQFINGQDEVIFTMPAMFMFDSSSEIPEYNYDIETTITPIKNGYLLTITPDSDWLNSDDRVYPVMIDPEVTTTYGTNSCFIYEKYPDVTHNYNMISFGGDPAAGNRRESYLYIPLSFIHYSSNICIESATLNLYFLQNTYTGNNMPVDIYSVNTEPFQKTWNSFSGIDQYNTYINSINVEEGASGYHSADITKLVWSWYNYDKTTQTQGIPNYGIKLRTKNADTTSSRYHRIWSTTSNIHKPYIEMTYTIHTDYTMGYAPYKYNNFLTVDNFQDRMNCYSYALQMYYRGTGSYAIYPGEIGIGQQISNDTYNALTYEQLMEYYDSFVFPIKSRIDTLTGGNELYVGQLHSYIANDNVLSTLMNNYMNFVENQMRRDSEVIGFDIEKYNNEDVIYNSIDLNIFTPPSDYNEGNERIIAMTAYYLYKGRFNGSLTMHYYMRHGNGTCMLHGGNCSLWSQKMGLGAVSNLDSLDNILCDQTIIDSAYNIGEPDVACDDNLVNFYSITKDTNIYASWYGNGQYDESTGTPYLSLT